MNATKERDFRRRPDETATAWQSRLAAVNLRELSAEELRAFSLAAYVSRWPVLTGGKLPVIEGERGA